jgi:ubiquinone/menaquinone biosynthesis C-methylase UbiE
MPNLWTNPDHANLYLSRIDEIPHRTEGEAALLEFLPSTIGRFLDVGMGNGRLTVIVKSHAPEARAVGLDFSPTMLTAARQRFAEEPQIEIVEHDLTAPLPDLGAFDAAVSSFAIHHLPDERKRTLYEELFRALKPGGVFLNLEHVSSPTPQLHVEFLHAIGRTLEMDDPSNLLAPVETQLAWLREIGFAQVDCHWKWREFALIAGRKPE